MVGPLLWAAPGLRKRQCRVEEQTQKEPPRFKLQQSTTLSQEISIPAIDADIKFAIVPASMARKPRRARSPRRLGASAPIPPIWIPMELKLAKPHSANVAMVKERGSSADLIVPSLAKAINSLRTMRVPRRFPIAAASCQRIPISHATGAS